MVAILKVRGRYFGKLSVADPGFPRCGSANSRGGGRQYTILPNFSKNCMKLKEFGPRGRIPRAAVDPPLIISLSVFGGRYFDNQ